MSTFTVFPISRWGYTFKISVQRIPWFTIHAFTDNARLTIFIHWTVSLHCFAFSFRVSRIHVRTINADWPWLSWVSLRTTEAFIRWTSSTTFPAICGWKNTLSWLVLLTISVLTDGTLCFNTFLAVWEYITRWVRVVVHAFFNLANVIEIQLKSRITLNTSILNIKLCTVRILAGPLTISTIKYVVWSASYTCSVTIVCHTVWIVNYNIILVSCRVVKGNSDACLIHKFISAITACTFSWVDVPCLA